MATTTTVPGKFDVGLDGRGFMIDTQYLEGYRSQTLEPIRRQADSSGTVGESSLNPEGYWRRSPESWHKGAGQTRYDANDSDPERFYWSEGVDVWTEGQLSLLPLVEDSGVAAPSGGTITRCIEAGFNLFAVENNGSTNLYVWSDIASNPPTVQTLTGTDITDICVHPTDTTKFFYVDNGRLYVATSSTVVTAGNLTSATEWIGDSPTTISEVVSAGGRLFCTDTSGDLYDISATSLATLPTALATGFGERLDAGSSSGYIYFVNVSNPSGEIYKTTIKSDGSGLEIPTVAATLPKGGDVYGIYTYLSFVIIQLDLGLRLAVVGSDGSLTIGEEFASGDVVQMVFHSRDFAADGQYVYVNGFDNTLAPGSAGGLLRLDLSTINDALVPAHAADLDIGGNLARFTYIFNNRKYIVSGTRVLWRENTTDFVSGGTVNMGDVSFGTREPKLFLAPVDTTSDGVITHTFTLPDGTTVNNANTATAVPSVSWKMALVPDVATDDMTVQYPILRALPVPAYIEIETVPVLLHDHVVDRNGQDTAVDTDAQLDYLRGLRDGGTLIDYQDGRRTRSAQVIGVDRIPAQRDSGGYQWQGTAVVRMKVLQ